LVVAPFITAVADRTNRRVTILQLASLLVALSMLPLAFTSQTGFTFFFVIMLVQALFRSPLVPLSETIISHMATNHGLNFGSLRLWGSLAFAAMAILGGWLWDSWGYALMFLVTAVLILPSIWLAGRLEEAPRPLHHASHNHKSPFALLSLRGLTPLLIVTFLAGIPLALSFNYDGLYIQALGGNDIYAGLMFGLAALSELPAMQFSQTLSRRTSPSHTLLVGLSLLLVAMIGYTFSPTPTVLLAFAVMRGLGFGFFLISAIQLVQEISPSEWSSTTQSLRNASTFGLSALLAAPLGGWLLDNFGAPVIYLVASVLLSLALLVLVAAMRGGVFREDTAVVAPLSSSSRA
jgi:MFS transporter, PPP family, 3-phenylpropionic acid transporter